MEGGFGKRISGYLILPKKNRLVKAPFTAFTTIFVSDFFSLLFPLKIFPSSGAISLGSLLKKDLYLSQ